MSTLDKEFESFIHDIFAVDMDTLAVNLLEGLGFNGFEPHIILKKIYTLGKKRHPTESGKDLASTIFTDMNVLLSFYVTRGTNFVRDDLERRTKSMGALRLFRGVAKDYTVRVGVKSQDDITLSRIASCFPHVVYLLNLNSHSKKTGPRGDLPAEWQFPQAPTLWTEQEAKENGEKWIRWMFEFQKRINKKGRKSSGVQQERIADFDEFEQQQRPIMEAMMSSDYTASHLKVWRSIIKSGRNKLGSEEVEIPEVNKTELKEKTKTETSTEGASSVGSKKIVKT